VGQGKASGKVTSPELWNQETIEQGPRVWWPGMPDYCCTDHDSGYQRITHWDVRYCESGLY